MSENEPWWFEEGKIAMQELKNEVAKLLVTHHDFLADEAEETVEMSLRTDPAVWHENSDAAELAKILASDDGDEVV